MEWKPLELSEQDKAFLEAIERFRGQRSNAFLGGRREVKSMGYQPFQPTPIDAATMAEIEATMQHLEETAQLKDEPLLWQSYNDYPAPLAPSVDRALISHDVAPIRLDDAFKHVMDARQLWKTVDVAILSFFWGAIAAILISLLWILR